MTIGDAIALCGLWALIGWYLWLVQRAAFREADRKARRDG